MCKNYFVFILMCMTFSVMHGEEVWVESDPDDSSKNMNLIHLKNNLGKIDLNIICNLNGRCGNLSMISNENNQSINMKEVLSRDVNKHRVSLVKTMAYKVGERVQLISGSVNVMVDGKQCLKGSLAINGDELSVRGTGFMDRDFKEVESSTEVQTKELPSLLKERGVQLSRYNVISMQTLSIFAPMLLPKDGVSNKLLVVKFPGDLNPKELISISDSYILKRKSNEKEGFSIGLYIKGRVDPIQMFMYNNEGAIIEVVTRDYRFNRNVVDEVDL